LLRRRSPRAKYVPGGRSWERPRPDVRPAPGAFRRLSVRLGGARRGQVRAAARRLVGRARIRKGSYRNSLGENVDALNLIYALRPRKFSQFFGSVAFLRHEEAQCPGQHFETGGSLSGRLAVGADVVRPVGPNVKGLCPVRAQAFGDAPLALNDRSRDGEQ